MTKFWFLVKNFLKKRIISKTFLFINIFLFVVIALVIIIPSNLAKKDSNAVTDNIKCCFYSELLFTDEEQVQIINKLKPLQKNYPKISFAFVGEKDYQDCDILVTIAASDKHQNWEITVTGLPSSSVVKDLIISLKNTHLDNSFTNHIEVHENKEKVMADAKQKIVLFFIIGFISISSGIAASCSQIAGSDVLTDKSSRVIEQILMNVSTRSHFYSKVVGGLIFGIIQSLLMLGYIFIALLFSAKNSISHVSNIFNFFNLTFPVGFASVSVILVTFFTTSLAVIIGAIATSQEEYSQIMGPLNIFIMFAFYGAMFIGMNQKIAYHSTISQVLSYLPVTGLAMAPISLLTETILWHEAVIAILLQISYIYNFLELFFPKYRHYILNYNTKQSIWKKIFAKLKRKRG